ncbi:MAG: thiamine pyrophosphate-binding protein [Burkholderiales bacterium]|mgnify:CR=1 FL=1|nr:thiamine pyrophosphate-binding protein [Burkholderiales bacterium]OUT78478.1 MAG: thiamine pyrophosphate-binding protein [Betaproteobacteria bacterium TMED22]|tara:strand:- start:8453 stop:10111 length:1659 start_codon:yes stop_codon:yes gene_type:complete
MRSGGQVLVDQLITQGVRNAFCVPGESYLAVLDALYLKREKISLYVARQDGGASFMAEAYGKATGETGICFVTRGPGATNASIGVHTAYQDSTPMILFIGQVGNDMVEREAFQEMDYRRMFGQMSKWVAQIDRANRIPEYVARAFHVANSGRPGPVVLALPEDMLVDWVDVPDTPRVTIAKNRPTAQSMLDVKELLRKSEKPLVVLGGSGWSERACRQVQSFIEKNKLPVGCSFRRQDLFDNHHPNYVGDIGIGINPKLSEMVKESDLLLVIGARLGEMTTSGYTLIQAPTPRQKLIHIHPGSNELGRVFQGSVMINSDIEEAVDALVSLPDIGATWGAWLKTGNDNYRANVIPVSSPGDVDLGEVMTVLRGLLPRDSVITNGAGNFSGWIHRHWQYAGYKTQVAPTNGAMGYGVPAGVAAKIALPDKFVVSVSGDGCFLMNGQEISTANQYGLKILFIVFDNGMFGTIRMHQERDYPEHVYGTDLMNPDFAALARAYGLYAETITSTEDIKDSVARCIEKDVASLIHIKVDPEAITTRTTLTSIRDNALSK